MEIPGARSQDSSDRTDSSASVPVNAAPRVNDTALLGDLCRRFPGCDGYNMRFLRGEQPPDSSLGVPDAVDVDGIDLNAVATVDRLDDHRRSFTRNSRRWVVSERGRQEARCAGWQAQRRATPVQVEVGAVLGALDTPCVR
jgi:hypothetical protein